MGTFDVKNEKKAPLGSDRKIRGLSSGNTVQSEYFSGTSEVLNALQVNFNCGEGNEGGRFLECLQVTTSYLSMKLEGGGDVDTSIRNRRVFKSAWTDPVGPNPEATKAMLHAEYGTWVKRVEKLWINLSTSYGLVLGHCTYYLRSQLEGQDK